MRSITRQRSFARTMSLAALAGLLGGGVAFVFLEKRCEAVERLEAASAAAPEVRLREGAAVVDQLGYFRLSGDRATFYSSDNKSHYGGLENLTLERVVNAIGESPDQLLWSVSGTITEYRGANYLLVSRAVLKSKLESKPAKLGVGGPPSADVGLRNE